MSASSVAATKKWPAARQAHKTIATNRKSTKTRTNTAKRTLYSFLMILLSFRARAAPPPEGVSGAQSQAAERTQLLEPQQPQQQQQQQQQQQPQPQPPPLTLSADERILALVAANERQVRQQGDRLMSMLKLEDMISRSSEPFWFPPQSRWLALTGANGSRSSSDPSDLLRRPAQASLLRAPEAAIEEAGFFQEDVDADSAPIVGFPRPAGDSGNRAELFEATAQREAAESAADDWPAAPLSQSSADPLAEAAADSLADDSLAPSGGAGEKQPGETSSAAPFDNLTTIDPLTGATIDTITNLELDPETQTPFARWSTWTIAVLIGLCVLLTVLGNILVLLSFVYERNIRQPSNYFICSLALSDLSIGIVSMPFFAIYVLRGWRWTLGPFWCDLWLATDHTVCLVSIYTVLLITVDRFFSIKAPTKYREWRTKRKVIIMIIVTWVVPFAIFFGTIMSWDWITGKRDLKEYECSVQFLKNPVFSTSLILFYFYSTLAIMFVLYAGIYKTARDLAKKSENKQKRMQLMMSMQQQQAEILARYMGADSQDARSGKCATRKDRTGSGQQGGVSAAEQSRASGEGKRSEKGESRQRADSARTTTEESGECGARLARRASTRSRELANTPGHAHQGGQQYQRNLVAATSGACNAKKSGSKRDKDKGGRDKDKSAEGGSVKRILGVGERRRESAELRGAERQRLNAAQQLAHDSLCLGLAEQPDAGGARNKRQGRGPNPDLEASNYELDRESNSRSSSPSFESDDDSPVGGASSSFNGTQSGKGRGGHASGAGQQSRAIIAQLRQKHKNQSGNNRLLSSGQRAARGLFSGGRLNNNNNNSSHNSAEAQRRAEEQAPRQQPLIPRSPIILRNELRDFMMSTNSSASPNQSAATKAAGESTKSSAEPSASTKREQPAGKQNDSNKESNDSAISSTQAQKSPELKKNAQASSAGKVEAESSGAVKQEAGQQGAFKCSCGQLLDSREELSIGGAEISEHSKRRRSSQQERVLRAGEQSAGASSENKRLSSLAHCSHSISYTDSLHSGGPSGSDKDSTVSMSSLSSFNSRHSHCDCCSLCSIQTDSQLVSSQPTGANAATQAAPCASAAKTGGHLHANTRNPSSASSSFLSSSNQQVHSRHCPAAPEAGSKRPNRRQHQQQQQHEQRRPDQQAQSKSLITLNQSPSSSRGAEVASDSRMDVVGRASRERAGSLGQVSTSRQSVDKLPVKRQPSESKDGRRTARKPSGLEASSEYDTTMIMSSTTSSQPQQVRQQPKQQQQQQQQHHKGHLQRSGAQRLKGSGLALDTDVELGKCDLGSGIGVTSLLASAGLKTASQAAAAAAAASSATIKSRLRLASRDQTTDHMSSTKRTSAGSPLVRSSGMMVKPRIGMRHKSKSENRARKALRTISFILGAFVLCWTPYHILALVTGFCTAPEGCVNTHLFYFTYFLCYTNSPINPFCYALANAQFKRAFYRVLKCNF